MAAARRFQLLVEEAKKGVREVDVREAKRLQEAGAVLIDVREQEDYGREHASGAVHLSRGVIELRIEEQVPDTATPILCYCGGGSRSALVAESLQKMGYTNVASVAGGFKSWKAEGLETG